MNRIVLLFLMSNFYILHSFAQDLSKDKLLIDLTYLNEAFKNGHPVNYKQQNNNNIQNLISGLDKIQSDTLTSLEYSLCVEEAIYNIGCVHTSISKNPLLQHTSSFKYFPLKLKIEKDELIIENSKDKNLIGYKIISINNFDAKEIIQTFAHYKASDGKTNAFSNEYFLFASSKLISVLLNNPITYIIKTDKGEFTISALDKPLINGISEKSYEYLLTNNDNYLFYQNEIAILKIKSFSKSDKKFIRKTFQTIALKNSKVLILDLRQNLGGNRSSTIELTKYLVDTTFSYSILQPHLQTRKYLNRKGKFFLFLSKLKYNIGNVFKGHKSEFGREFTYNYKPKTKYIFNGQIYVLTDGFTASAATMVTSWLKQHTGAKFYGSLSSGGYNGNNGGSFPTITLPNSKIEIKFPAFRLILDKNSSISQGIMPDSTIQIGSNYADIINQIIKK